MSKTCTKCSKTVYPLEELKCLDKVSLYISLQFDGWIPLKDALHRIPTLNGTLSRGLIYFFISPPAPISGTRVVQISAGENEYYMSRQSSVQVPKIIIPMVKDQV